MQKYYLRANVTLCKSIAVQNYSLGVNSTLCKSEAHTKVMLKAKVITCVIVTDSPKVTQCKHATTC